MRKILYFMAVIGLLSSACKLPVSFSDNATEPAPLTVGDLEMTATARAQQSDGESSQEFLPTPILISPSATNIPSNTPQMVTATQTTTAAPSTTPIPSDTPSAAPSQTSTPAAAANSSVPATAVTFVNMVIVSEGTVTNPSATPVKPTSTITPAATAQILIHGTMPPAVPYGKITLVNMSKADAYISLQCTTLSGEETIMEYPVKAKIRENAPAGNYLYVLWVGGKKIVGTFHLDRSQELQLTIYKDEVRITDLPQ